ncbi:MAG: hypothetical protein KTR19_03555 [Hyphomicrobiales bacterium]|nr:hypothetical protein [Hyphomicrobiales bacterium]
MQFILLIRNCSFSPRSINTYHGNYLQAAMLTHITMRRSQVQHHVDYMKLEHRAEKREQVFAPMLNQRDRALQVIPVEGPALRRLAATSNLQGAPTSHMSLRLSVA